METQKTFQKTIIYNTALDIDSNTVRECTDPEKLVNWLHEMHFVINERENDLNQAELNEKLNGTKYSTSWFYRTQGWVNAQKLLRREIEHQLSTHGVKQLKREFIFWKQSVIEHDTNLASQIEFSYLTQTNK